MKMISKNQLLIFGQKILEEKIVTAMFVTMLTLPLFSVYGHKYYAINDSIAIVVMLVTAILVIPNTKIFVASYSKYIKNALAISIIIYGIASYFLNNYGSLKIGGDILVILSILLIVEANPIIIDSVKKWWIAE